MMHVKFVKAQDQLLELVNDFKNDESNSAEEKEYLILLENEVNEKKIQG